MIANFDNDKLKSIVARIERLEEQKAALASDIRDIFTEAKSSGYDAAVIRQVIRERRKDAAKREEQLNLFDLYFEAVR